MKRAYRANPKALVRTTYFLTDTDKTGPQYEDLTVRELAKTHLQSIESSGTRCGRVLRRQLTELLRKSP